MPAVSAAANSVDSRNSWASAALLDEKSPHAETLLPQDGCVLLGKDESSATCLYATRFHLHSRAKQRDSITRHVVNEVLVPCCYSHIARSWREILWGFIRSEIFLIFLHLTVLTLGLLKVFVYTLEAERELHLVHSVLETSLACTIVIIRAFVCKEKFHDVKDARLRVEYVRRVGDSRSMAIKVWTYFQFVVALLLCTVCIGGFVVFYLNLHLGWLVLTNNFAVIFSTFLSTLTLQRMTGMINRITLDQHKMVIHEAALLLSELYWAQSPMQKRDVRQRVEIFCKGLKETPFFHRPTYIACTEDDPSMDVVTSVESGV